MHWTDAMGWHGGWLMGGMWLIWIALLVVFVLVMRDVLTSKQHLDRPDAPRRDGADPEETLKQRYARGELGPDEYQATLADLRR